MTLRDQIQKLQEQQEYTRLHQSMLYTREQVQSLIDQNYGQAHNEGVTKALDCMERLYGKISANLQLFSSSGARTMLDINHNDNSPVKYGLKYE